MSGSVVAPLHLSADESRLCNVQVTEKGLTSEQHAQRLQEYGPNKLPEGTRNPILVYLGCDVYRPAQLLHIYCSVCQLCRTAVENLQQPESSFARTGTCGTRCRGPWRLRLFWRSSCWISPTLV